MKSWAALGLTKDEADAIIGLLGREPSDLEWGMFAAMWSEHCSYKHSRPLLAGLPRGGDAMLVGPGENAGAIDVGGSRALVFKIESHNHPSYIDPYQGAATGVGGILRDVIALGARPLGVAVSVRIGDVAGDGAAENEALLKGIARGVHDYGREARVPVTSLELASHSVYDVNPLVNAMAVGIVEHRRLTRGGARKPGSTVVLFGGDTGRDGVHGAALSSMGQTEGSDADAGGIQVGDPAMARKVFDAALEMVEQGLLTGLQDLGAAGLTSSGAEMAERGGVGMEIHLDRVPLRTDDLTPYEIALSESQERMMAVIEPEHMGAVESICRRAGVHCAAIGTVTEREYFTLYDGGRVVADIPVAALTEAAPTVTYPVDGEYDLYPEGGLQRNIGAGAVHRGTKGAAPSKTAGETGAGTVRAREVGGAHGGPPQPGKFSGILERLLRHPDLFGRGAAAMPAPDGSGTAVAALYGPGRITEMNPRLGAAMAVAGAARQVACTGARPLGLTNCLNYGDPRRPSVYSRLAHGISGLGEAARALGLPITGGNVSLYNSTESGDIWATPVVGVIGFLDGRHTPVDGAFKEEGDEIFILTPSDYGSGHASPGGSLYAELAGAAGPLPALDLGHEARLLAFLTEGASRGIFRSAMSIGSGGLAAALARGARRPAGFGGSGGDSGPGLGGTVSLPASLAAAGLEGALFGEGGGRAMVTAGAGGGDLLTALAARHGIGCHAAGRVGGDRLTVSAPGADMPIFDISLEHLPRPYGEGVL